VSYSGPGEVTCRMSETNAALPTPILLYDGVCGLCHHMVRLTIRLDRQGRFHYAPLQGQTAETLRQRHPEIPEATETIVLEDAGRVFLRSAALFHAARHLPYPWRLASWFRWLPALLCDPAYRLVAATRYRIFGRYDSCRLPNTEQKERLLP